MESRPREGVPTTRVLYLGSGTLGIPVLDALRSSPEINLVGVGTQPDRPAGRSRKSTPTPLALHASGLGLEVLKPSSVNTPEFLSEVQSRRPDIIVVVAFGQLLKSALLTAAPHGCFNVHASLLPRHRGASPIVAAILEGDRKTGISFMSLDSGMDTGPVFRRIEISIPVDATTATLERALSELAASEVVETLTQVVRGELRPVPQDDAHATVARKIRKNDGIVDWTQSAAAIERQVRAFQPWPKSTCFMPCRKALRRLQIVQATTHPLPEDAATGAAPLPGRVVCLVDGRIWIACGNDALGIERLIPEGSREMASEEFLCGTNLSPGTELLGRTSDRVQQLFKGLR